MTGKPSCSAASSALERRRVGGAHEARRAGELRRRAIAAERPDGVRRRVQHRPWPARNDPGQLRQDRRVGVRFAHRQDGDVVFGDAAQPVAGGQEDQVQLAVPAGQQELHRRRGHQVAGGDQRQQTRPLARPDPLAIVALAGERVGLQRQSLLALADQLQQRRQIEHGAGVGRRRRCPGQQRVERRLHVAALEDQPRDSPRGRRSMAGPLMAPAARRRQRANSGDVASANSAGNPPHAGDQRPLDQTVEARSPAADRDAGAGGRDEHPGVQHAHGAARSGRP